MPSDPHRDPDQEKLDDLAARIRLATAKPEEEYSIESKADSSSISRIGFDFMAAVVGGAILGVLVDRTMHTKPWGVVIAVTLSFAAGMANVWKALNAPTTKNEVKNEIKSATEQENGEKK